MKTQLKALLIVCIGLLLLSTDVVYSQTILTLQPDSTEGKDAYITSRVPTANRGVHGGFYSAGWTWSGQYGTIRSFIEFDLTTIPPNSNILSATLTLYNDATSASFLTGGEHSNVTASNESYLSRVTDPWEELTINWNNQPGFSTTDQAILPEHTDPNQDYPVDVTDMVQYFADNPSENYGFVLRLKTETNYALLLFGSSDNDDSSIHPKLEVTYDAAVGLDELEEAKLISNVFPNPFNDKVTIDLSNTIGEVNISVHNLIGQTIMTEESINKKTIELDLENAPAGLYFIRINSALEEKVIRVVKE